MRTLFVTLLLAGCGGGAPVVRYEARPLVPLFRPAPAVDLSDVSKKPFKRDRDVMDPLAAIDHLPDAGSKVANKGAKEKDPRTIVAADNRENTVGTEEDDGEGYTRVYAYDPDQEFEIYGCLKQDIRVVLAPGEHFNIDGRKNIAKGWKHSLTQAGDNHGAIVEVVILKQVAVGQGVQHAWFATNIGDYGLALYPGEEDETRCMRKVRFRHPERELHRLIVEQADRDEEEAEKPVVTASDKCSPADPDTFEFEVLEGSPRWVPTKVCSKIIGTQAHVRIEFPPEVSRSKIPAFMCDGGTCDYRYDPDPVHPAIIVDNLFSRGLLKMGSAETGYERVAIRRLQEAR